MSVLTAVDTIHTYVANIPSDDRDIQQVNGYITQMTADSDIAWSDADWQRFPQYIKKRIAQLPVDDPMSADIIDSENGAATIPATVAWIKAKHARKQIAVVYVSADHVKQLYQAVAAAGELDQTYLWLADWNLDEVQAAALLDTRYEGIPVLMVQWASPSSNPNTLLPGSNYKLADCGCDLSVAIDFPDYVESKVVLTSVMVVATYSDGSKKSWTA